MSERQDDRAEDVAYRQAAEKAPALMLPRRRMVVGGLCLCCLPSLTRRAVAASDVAPARMMQVAPGLFVRRGVTEDASRGNDDAIANIGFVVGQDAVAIFDPGGSLGDGESLRLAIRRETHLPVRYVILSHVHPDHVFGAAAFVAERPIFVGHARLPDALAERGEYYRRRLDEILGAGHAGSVVTPTLLVHDRMELDLGGRTLVLTAHAPAHTACDLSMTDPATGTLLAGDLLFVDRVPSLDGDLKGWLAELAKLRKAGATFAVPGHGPVQVDWPGAASDIERYLSVLLAGTRQAVAKGVPIEQAASQVARSERGRWKLFDDYNAHNVIEAYQQLEWE